MSAAMGAPPGLAAMASGRRDGPLLPRYGPRRHAGAGHGGLSKRTPRSSHMFLCSHDVSEFMLHA